MAIYTISTDYIIGSTNDIRHLLLIYNFANPDSVHKASMDKSRKLLELYSNIANQNNDICTWLDFMSKQKESAFEIINVTIPENTPEEELYLMVASSTKSCKKVIVNSHEYWQSHSYITDSNKILYNSQEITVLSKEELYHEINDDKQPIQNISINMKKSNNPWTSGSFYLLASIVLIVIIGGLLIFKIIPVWSLPLIILSVLILISVIGALQLKNDEILSDEAFVKLMLASLKGILSSNKKGNNSL